MDIHKPKPFHGFREFLKEYGIIVLGVVTALALEQTVEALHWHEMVKTERTSLLDEVQSNLSAVQSRLRIQPCVDKRLAELKLVFDRHAHSRPLGLVAPVGVPLPVGGSKGTWQIALSGQGLSHMPYSEQTDFSGAFDNYKNWDVIRSDERAAWVKLGALDDAQGLTDSDWALLRQAYAQARADTRRVASVGAYIMQSVTMGQKPERNPDMDKAERRAQIAVGDVCRPMLAP